MVGHVEAILIRTSLRSITEHAACTLRKRKKNTSFFLSAIVMAGQPTPLTYPPPRNKGLIAGLIKGNQKLGVMPHAICESLEM